MVYCADHDADGTLDCISSSSRSLGSMKVNPALIAGDVHAATFRFGPDGD